MDITGTCGPDCDILCSQLQSELRRAIEDVLMYFSGKLVDRSSFNFIFVWCMLTAAVAMERVTELLRSDAPRPGYGGSLSLYLALRLVFTLTATTHK